MLAIASPVGQWSLHDRANVSFVVMEPSVRKAWTADGKPISFDSLPKPMAHIDYSWLGRLLLVFYIRQPKLQQTPSGRFKLPTTAILYSKLNAFCSGGKGAWMLATPLPDHQPDPQNVSVGISDGPWQFRGGVTYAVEDQSLEPISVKGQIFRAEVVKNKSQTFAKRAIRLRLTTSGPFRDVDVRYKVLNRKGRELLPQGSYRDRPDSPTIYIFAGHLEDIARIDIETRPFEWKTIPGVHLRPNP